LNHDKKTDLVALWGPNNSADVFLGNGDGTFQEAQAYKLLGFVSSRLTIADVNVDGKPDLVSASMSRTLSGPPDEGSVSVLLNVFTDTTTTTLSSSLNPSIYGQKVTWRARVTTSGSIPPTGRVIFRTSGDGQNYEIGAAALDGSWVATLTRSTLNVPTGGPYSLVAVYLGDTMNSRSQSEVVLQDVRQTTSAATITSSANPSSLGQAVTFTARITSPTVTVTGPVTFTAGNTVLGTVQLSRGTATFTTSALPRGAIRVQVTYPWNSNVAKSSASLVQTVQ
jgi:Big-like domain-containing protein/VCBS repeat protein